MPSEPKTRIESDSMGEIAVPGGPLLGRADPALAAEFPHRRRAHAAAADPRLRPAEAGGGRDQHDSSASSTGSSARPSPRPRAEVVAGKLDEHFPLVVWQTGSGTQTNMNANEVIANRANEMLAGKRGGKTPVHPNDHVNMGQSSNDSFPTAMHIAAAQQVRARRDPGAAAPAAGARREGRRSSPTSSRSAAPTCRTRRRSPSARSSPATPRRCELGIARVEALPAAPLSAGPGRHRRRHRAQRHGRLRRGASPPRSRGSPACPSSPRANKFEALAAHDAIVELSGAYNVLAVSLMKIANDIRLLGSGPRSGLGELHAAGERARLLDHAGQGQPDPGRGADHGRDPGHGQPRHRHRRRQPGPFRAQRVQAGDDLQRAAIRPADRRRLRQLHRQLRRRHRAEPRADQAAAATSR